MSAFVGGWNTCHVKGLASCAKRELYLNVMIPAAAIKKN